MSFDRPVPIRGPGGACGRALTRDGGGTRQGAFGRAVRTLAGDAFAAILAAGFRDDPWERSGEPVPGDAVAPPAPGFAEEPAAFVRPWVEQTDLRPVRDLAFRRAVRRAYGNRRALTGLAPLNGGGWPEVQAAHIMPVAHDGPGSVRNGLALSGTLRRLFDPGLASVPQDGRIPAEAGGGARVSGRPVGVAGRSCRAAMRPGASTEPRDGGDSARSSRIGRFRLAPTRFERRSVAAVRLDHRRRALTPRGRRLFGGGR